MCSLVTFRSWDALSLWFWGVCSFMRHARHQCCQLSLNLLALPHLVPTGEHACWELGLIRLIAGDCFGFDKPPVSTACPPKTDASEDTNEIQFEASLAQT